MEADLVEPGIRRRTPGTSGWALVAALCSSVLFCPPLPLVGAVLGFFALRHVRRVPGRGGRRLAIAAIVIGTVATLWWGAVGYWWNVNARRPMIEGPRQPLIAGLDGDVDAFRDAFLDIPGGSDEDALVFLEQLETRYGRLVDLVQGEGGVNANRPVLQDGRVTIPYRLHFTMTEMPAEAQFVVFQPGSASPILRFAWLRVIDADRGDLVYPPQ